MNDGAVNSNDDGVILALYDPEKGTWTINGKEVEPPAEVIYGVYDTEDHSWLGNNDGPFQYRALDLARIAAQVFDVRMRYQPGRFRAIPYFCPQPVRRGDVKSEIDGVEALKMIEDGRAI